MKHLYNITFSTSRPTVSIDKYGSESKAWTTRLTGQSGRIWSTGESEYQWGNRTATKSDYALYCDVLDITVKDRVVCGTVTYEVTRVDNPHNLDRFLRCEMVLIK